MNDTIKNLRKRVLELELSDADKSAKKVFLSAFERMTFETDADFDKYLVEALKGLQTKPKESEPSKEEIESVKNLLT